MSESQKFQYKPFLNPTLSKEQKQKIEEDVKKNLFKLPDEEEIEDNLNKQEQLKKLDEEYQIKKAELEMKKNQMAADKISKLEEEQNRLAQRLEQIINDPEEEEEFEKKIEVIKQRLQVKSGIEKDLKVQKEIDLKRKEHDIEKKVRKKLELERLLERKKVLNQQFQMTQFQYDVIREEEEARNIENITLLERALKRKGLDGNIDEKDKKLIAMTLAGHKADTEKEVEQILAQVQALKEQKKKEEQIQNKEKQKQLNDKRFQLMQQQEELIKKKAIYHEIKKKGEEYQQEMEMGQAPPREFIEKNLQYNDEDYREFRTVEQIVERTKQQIETAQDKIYELRKELDENQYRYLDEINYYKGELKPLIERMNPESVFIAKYIIDFCIDNVLKKEIDDRNLMDAADFKLKQLEEKQKKLEQFEDKQFDQQIMKQIRNEMISRVYKQLALEAGNEIVTINNMAKNTAENIIVRALKQERPVNSNVNELDIRTYFYETRYPVNFQRIYPTPIEIDFEDYQEGQGYQLKQKNRQKFNDQFKMNTDVNQKIQDLDNDQQDSEEDDLDVILLNPEKECVEVQGTANLINKELDYFSGFDLQNDIFFPSKKDMKRFVSSLNLSFNKSYLAVGYSNGEIILLDVQQNPPQIVGKCVTDVKSMVLELQFPFDSVSQILAIYENGECRIFFNGQNLALEKLKNKNQVQPASYLEYYSLNWKILTRSIKRFGDEQNQLKIRSGTFHPTVTFTGFQPFVLVGSQNGTILKFNSNKDIQKGLNYRFPIHRVVNNHILSPQDVEYPNELQNFFKVEDNQQAITEKFERLGRPQPEQHIYREFFNEHKNLIVFISFLENPSRFVSVDEKGYVYVWEYTKFFYNGTNGGYKPSTKNRIFLGSPCFESKSNPIQLFPFANQKDFDRESKRYFEQIFLDKDFQRKKISEKKADTRGTVVINKDMLDHDNIKQGDDAIIWKAMVDYQKKQVLELYEEKTQIQIKKGYVKSGASLPENKQIILQMIMPHKIEENQEYVQFIRFDTQTCKLKKTKAILESPKMDRQEVIPFRVIENLQPFAMPYLFVMMKQGLFIISLSTGSIVSKITTHLNTIYNDLKFSNTYCTSFVNLFDDHIYIGVDYADGIWKFQIKDENSKKNKLVISNLANDYFRLYLL